MTRSLRALMRTPGFFALAIAALALGAGSATAMFSVTESMLWRPLPFPDAERMVLVTLRDPKSIQEGEPVTRTEFRQWREGAHSFQTLAATNYGATHDIAGPGFGERGKSQSVTADFFALLGAAPAIGRGFLPQEETAAAHVAVLTDAYWRSHFDGAPEAVGRSIKVDGVAFTIVGVLPAAFHLDFTRDPDLYLPLDMSGVGLAASPRRELGAIGRLRDGVSADAARSESQAIYAAWAATRADKHAASLNVNVENLRVAFTKFQRGSLGVFFGFAWLALLVACANIAALQLARYAARRRECALRLALGANRLRLLAEAAGESAWIAGLGGAAGCLFAAWGLEALKKFMPAGEFVRGAQIQMDAWTLAFVLAVSIGATLLFAAAPVLSSGRVDLNAALRESSQGLTSGAGTLLRIEALIAAEVTLSFLLLFAAGLFVRSHAALLQVPLGFDPSHVAAIRVSPGGAERLSQPEALRYFSRVLDTASATPGITKASLSGGLPLMYDAGIGIPRWNGATDSSLARIISPGYFEVMSIGLVAGRGFTDRDSQGAGRVAIINRRLAARIFGAENPIGRTIQIAESGSDAISTGPVEIVGVAANTKELGQNEVDFSDVYLPFAQNTPRTIYLAVKTRGGADDAIATLRRELRGLDSEISISDAASMDDRIDSSLTGNRFRLFLVSTFAALAALLAAVGIYGAISFAVSRRGREFGLRVALGARPRAIVQLAIARACALGAAGGVCGFAAAWVMGSALRQTLYLEPGKHSGMLFGVAIHDPVSFAWAAAATLALSAVAAAAPALRAAGIDPLEALRAE